MIEVFLGELHTTGREHHEQKKDVCWGPASAESRDTLGMNGGVGKRKNDLGRQSFGEQGL